MISLGIAVMLNQANAQENYYKRLTASSGLLSDDNYMTYQDKDRFIWILSEKGIIKYDGSEFKPFTVANGLPLNDIWYMKEDLSGRKWLGGFYDGLCYIKNDKVTKVPLETSVNSLLFTCQRNDTLFFISLKDKRSFCIPTNLEKITEIELSDNDKIQIELEDKTITTSVSHQNEKITIVQSAINKKKTIFKGVVVGGDVILKMNSQIIPINRDGKRYWIVNNHGKYELIDPELRFGERIISTNTLHPTNQLVIQLENRILVYSNLAENIRNYDLEKKLSAFNSRRVSWFLQDDEQNIWLSVDRNNIIMLPNGSELIDQYHFETENQRNYINPIVENDQLVFHELQAGLFQFDLKTNKFSTVFLPDKRDFEGIFDLKKIDDGYVFLSIANIFHQPKNGPLVRYPIDIKISSSNRRQFLPINSKELIMNDFSSYSIENGVVRVNNPSNITWRASAMSHSKKEWIVSTPTELIFCDKETLKRRKVNISGIQCIQPYGENLLIGTNGYGLLLINPEGEILSQIHEGNVINEILCFNDYVLSATNHGLFVDVIENTKLIRKRLIGTEQGLSSKNVNSILAYNNKIIATNNRGFDLIDLEAILHLEAQVPTIIMDSVLNNGILSAKNKHEFGWDENSFSFHFSGISYGSLGNVDYKYRIKGVENDWVATNESSIRFPNLSPGTYRLEIKAISASGIESEIVTHEFFIQTHFSRTWWFSALVLLLVALVIGYVVFQLQRRKTKRLEIEKQIANLEMNALQSQMNPHFVFNSLNAIQSVLFLKGERETNRYIGAFSKLIRQTLDNSKKGAITVQEEVDYLTTYLDLESRRLDGELSHSIEIDDELEADSIRIPCMIVQPMVENSILHGLTPKKNNRQLTIRFLKKMDVLQIEVEDNGVGRKKSAEDSTRKEHKSWASTILKERLEVLEKINIGKITFDIIDLQEDNTSKGTLIKIQLPIVYED